MAAPNTIYVLESANLICGDTGTAAQPGVSTHLVLQELKLPGIDFNMMDHNAGGARVGIEVASHINKLESTFNLAGLNPDVTKLIGETNREDQRFTAYGLIRDRRTGRALQARAYIEGILGRSNPTNFQKGTLHAHEYAIRSIVHYEFYMQTGAGVLGADAALDEIIVWDFFDSTLRVGGKDINSEHNLILGIPIVAV